MVSLIVQDETNANPDILMMMLVADRVDTFDPPQVPRHDSPRQHDRKEGTRKTFRLFVLRSSQRCGRSIRMTQLRNRWSNP